MIEAGSAARVDAVGNLRIAAATDGAACAIPSPGGEQRVLDPLTLAVIQAGLQQVCNEMDVAFSRSAFSPVIAEADDRSDGIYAAEDGALIAQGEHGLPVFVGTMQYSAGELIRLIREGAVAAPQAGDIYIVNDPYLGGTHLMDVRFAMPFFHDGALFCWLSNTGHWPDTGGMVPGGFSAHATEVEQEGLRLPPVKLFKRGVMDREILSIILSNIRVADQRIGDIKAQEAALKVGERRLSELLARYGRATIEAAIAEIRARAAQRMRAEIAAIPDGTYRAESFVDSDGIVNEPLRIALTLTKHGDSMGFDFSGSSPPCRGPMNSVVATTYSAVYLAVRHVFPEVPINAGSFDPITIARPEGTFLDARYPRPVSGCAAEVSQRIAEAVFLALAQAIPEKLWAAPAGTSGNFALGGVDPRKGAGYVMYQITGGGYGGTAFHDGLTNGCSTIGISKTAPVEVMEQYYPVLFRRFALREGSGGAGAQRGGFGVHYEVELLAGEARASFVMDHGRFGPPGVLGGAAGAPNVVRIHRGAESFVPEHLSKDQDIAIGPGDRVEVMTPGGGGYGDPFARDPALVARDVRRALLHARGSRGALGRRADAGAAMTRRDGGAGARSPGGRGRTATADRVRGYGLSGESVRPHPVRLRGLDLSSGRGHMTAYFRPTTLDEALAIRAGRDVEIIAGGTDVYPNKTTRAGWGRMAHKDVLDVTAIPGLRRIEEVDGHWRIGALVTWTDVIRAGLPPLFDGLVAAAREIGGAQIQNRATLVGNLCTASPAGDGIPNLLALEAEVEIASLRGTRFEPVESFLDGYRHTTCGADEIVTALRIPKRSAAARGSFLKLGARRYLVISIVMAAAVVEIDADGAVEPCPHRRSAPARRWRAGCAFSRSGSSGTRSHRRCPRWCRPTISPSLRRSTTRGRAPPIASPLRRRSFATSSPASERRASGGPHDGASVPSRRLDDSGLAHRQRRSARASRRRRSRRSPISCATGSASPAPRSAATPAIAAPAPCCSTARRSAPASCRRRKPMARRCTPSRVPAPAARRSACAAPSSTTAPPSAASARPAC